MHRLAVLALAAVLAAPLAAQTPVPMPESYRATQLRMLQHQRRTILAMADSMPERLYTERLSAPQRTFAQQLTHAAGAAALIMSRFHPGMEATLPDTGAAHTTRAGLRAFVNAAYDAAERMLAAETADQRAAVVNLFGNQMPLWQVWDEVHMHTAWTTGQVVANFRSNGMAPPAFSFF